jgi:hypothetical protein
MKPPIFWQLCAEMVNPPPGGFTILNCLGIAKTTRRGAGDRLASNKKY